MRQQQRLFSQGDRFVAQGHRRGRRPRLVGLVVAALVATTVVATGTGATAAQADPAHRGGSPVQVLDPQPGSVIVASSASAAHTVRVDATLSITRRVGDVSVQLNGHSVSLPRIRPGRSQLELDAADGLVVGQNLLWVGAAAKPGPPQWVTPVRFVVGYHDTGALGVGLQLGSGTLAAATATLRLPTAGVDILSVTLNGAPVRVPAGARTLDLAQLGSLRWGSNALQVRLVMSDGRVDDWSRTFQLDPHRDIAVAELTGSVVISRPCCCPTATSAPRSTPAGCS